MVMVRAYVIIMDNRTAVWTSASVLALSFRGFLPLHVDASGGLVPS